MIIRKIFLVLSFLLLLSWIKPNGVAANVASIWTESIRWNAPNKYMSKQSEVRTMQEYQGNLYLSVTNFLDKVQIWKYDGTSYSMVFDVTEAAGFFYHADTMVVYRGNLYLGTGSWDAPTCPGCGKVYKFDGKSWTLVKDLNLDARPSHYIWTMKEYKGKLYLGATDNLYIGYIYSFDGLKWRYEKALSDLAAPYGYTGYLAANAIAVYNNKLYIGGGRYNQQAIIYSFDGVNWAYQQYLSPSAYVDSLTVFKGKLYANGSSYASATPTTIHIFEFDGSQWLDIKTIGTNNTPYAMGGYATADKLWIALHGGSADYRGVWSYDGSDWIQEVSSTLAPYGMGDIHGYKGYLYAGGDTTFATKRNDILTVENLRIASLKIEIPSENNSSTGEKSTASYRSINFTVNNTMSKRNPAANSDNQIQIRLTNGMIIPLAYQTTEDEQTVWTGKYNLPSGVTNLTSLEGTVEAIAYNVTGDVTTHFASTLSQGFSNTGVALNFEVSLANPGTYTITDSSTTFSASSPATTDKLFFIRWLERLNNYFQTLRLKIW